VRAVRGRPGAEPVVRFEMPASLVPGCSFDVRDPNHRCAFGTPRERPVQHGINWALACGDSVTVEEGGGDRVGVLGF